MILDAAAAAEAGGWASLAEVEMLAADRFGWAAALRRLVFETDDAIKSAERSLGEERAQVLRDLASERERLASALERLTGDRVSPPPELAGADGAVEKNRARGEPTQTSQGAPAGSAVLNEPVEAVLQGSWAEGRLVVWAGALGASSEDGRELVGLLDRTDASGLGWERHPGVPLPSGDLVEARSAPLSHILGWLVGIGAGQVGGPIGPSLRWIGQVAVWGTALVAEGRMVPVLRSVAGASPQAKSPAGRALTGRHRVRWAPALINREQLVNMAERMPGSVVALARLPQQDGACRAILASVVDAVCRAGADRLVVPAAVAEAITRTEVAEAFLSGLAGKPFSASVDAAGRLGEDLKRWASPVTGTIKVGINVRLASIEEGGGWLLSVEATGVDRQPLPVEHALAVASGAKSAQVEAQLKRLERLVPALRRPTTRRGQVVIDSEEAAELMFSTGPVLAAAGFEVYFPAVSSRRPSPQLKVFAETSPGKSQVGLAQLSDVRWSVLFDDLELDAAGIAKLVAEAKPLVKVRGKWLRLERSELAAAAAALASTAKITQLSGAELLRHAIGLEGSSLGGAVKVEGNGWAVDLVKGATSSPPAPRLAPEGFVGQLRHYQADAAGWLDFLDRAGLGGCLAMDMGLGKTPTVLAHLLADLGAGPTLVVCPPAVLNNWAVEAYRFTPSLRVKLHHGPRRVEPSQLPALARSADAVLTTYATAVRDMDALSQIEWRRVVVDEAQAIKNHQSDTARELRRLRADYRLALTGTPVENGLGDLWAILDFANPGLVGSRNSFIERLSKADPGEPREPGGQDGAVVQTPAGREEGALRALNGLLVFRRTKNEPEIAAELPDKVDKLDHCAMSGEQVGLYQAVLDRLVSGELDVDATKRKGQVLAAITALKQICDHPAAYLTDDDGPLDGRSGKLTRLEEIVEDVFAAGERVLIFTHFARWGERLAAHLSKRTGLVVPCYHGGLPRGTRDEMVRQFQRGRGPGALVLSIKAGGSGLNLTAANHVVLYDRWWNPAVEDQARDRAWRIGQSSTVVSHRLVCPGTVDERVEEIVAGKRRIAGLVLPAKSSLGDLEPDQLRLALGLEPDQLIEDEPSGDESREEEAA